MEKENTKPKAITKSEDELKAEKFLKLLDEFFKSI